MSWVLDRPWLAAAVLSVSLAAAFGLAFGTGVAGSEDDAAATREQAYGVAYEQSFAEVRAAAASRGRAEGESVGRQAGVGTGSSEGFDFAGGVTGVRIAQEQVQAAEAARFAAEAELAERQANCGAILKASDVCPTDEELAAYREAVKAAKEAEKPKKPDGQDSGQGTGSSDD